MAEPTQRDFAALFRRFSEVRVLRFGVVGASNAVIGFTVFRVALHAFAAFAYAIGTLWSYYWNRRWTFQSQGDVTGEAARFFGLQIGFMVLSATLLGLLVDRLRFAAGLSWFAVAVLTTLLNFVLSRYWAFKAA